MTIETHTTWGREFTPEEIVKLEERKDKKIAEGVIYLRSEKFNGIAIREWQNEEQANDWIEYVTAMNPPPLKVEIVKYGDE
jgi:hypothetical protein